MAFIAQPGIYCIRNLCSSDCYVGQSNHLPSRVNSHLSQIRNGKHPNPAIKRDVAKFGPIFFVVSVLEFCEHHKLAERERYWIKHLHPAYNRDSGRSTGSAALGINANAPINLTDGPHTYESVMATSSRRRKSCNAKIRICFPAPRKNCQTDPLSLLILEEAQTLISTVMASLSERELAALSVLPEFAPNEPLKDKDLSTRFKISRQRIYQIRISTLEKLHQRFSAFRS